MAATELTPVVLPAYRHYLDFNEIEKTDHAYKDEHLAPPGFGCLWFPSSSVHGFEGPRSAGSREPTTKIRFSAKRLAAQRAKLDLSAAEMGSLIGVSAQTIYNWEAEKSRPRQAQLVAIAATRGMGKRQIKARLEEVPSKETQES